MLANGLPGFHKNPYIIAMLFNGIAEGTLLVRRGEQVGDEEEAKRDPWELYFKPSKPLNPKLEWG